MNRELIIRNVLIATLVSTLALTACDRKSDTNEPDSAAPADTPATTEQPMNEGGTGTTTDDSTGDNTLSDDNMGSGDVTSDDSTTAPGSTSPEEQLVCTETWFKWVNDQVVSMHSDMIAEQYPSGLPDVGSDEWFIAVDKLTGGDGAHGPDGGSEEWCTMVQQRLEKSDSNNQ